jgi:parallel beta-helix repeat protein
LHFNYLKNSIVVNNIIKKNIDTGIRLKNSKNNLITYNIIQNNNPGILLVDSYNNQIINNNLITNVKSATFQHNDKMYRNVWFGNYWGKALNGPKFIDGIITVCVKWDYYGDCIKYRDFLRWNIDWSPANKPYDIPDTSNINKDIGYINKPLVEPIPLLNLFLQRL